jgi:demethylmenaquinone methyltransferase/2-methoxy-6-polyprenyl-1,4-benzoquinol methylase
VVQDHPRPARSSTNRFAQDLFAPLPRHYDLLVDLLSLGQNRRWRRTMVDQVLHVDGVGPPNGSRLALDVATGTGGVASQLVERTSVDVVGIDLSEAMLRQAVDNMSRNGAAGRVVLTLGRAEQLPFPDESFDAVTFTYLLRYVDDPAATLSELTRVLRPGGHLASLEFCVPPNRFWRAWWWLYTRLVLPAAGRAWGRGWYRVGRFLGPNISRHYARYPVSWHVDAWRKAGMTDVDTRLMSLGGGLVMWGRKGDERP